MLYPQSLVKGAMFIVASELMLATMGALIKWASDGLPNEMIVFFRNLFGLLALSPFLLRGGMRGLRTSVPHWHALRGLAGLGAMYCFFYAIGHLKLADAMLLKLTTPIFIPVVAYLWLNERMPVTAKAALIVGLLGVVLVLKPAGDVNWVMLVALGGSILAALAKSTIRRMAGTEPAHRIVFYFALFGTVVSSIPLSWSWVTPSPDQWLILLALGPIATLGQWFMTRGYASAAASQVGIFTFSAVLFGAAYGWAFWGEVWDALSMTGAILVAVAGGMALRGNRFTGGARRALRGSEPSTATNTR